MLVVGLDEREKPPSSDVSTPTHDAGIQSGDEIKAEVIYPR